MDRVKLFRIACAVAGSNMPEFAKEHGVSRQAIHQVLSGKLTSKRLTTEIDDFIELNLKKLNINIDLNSRKAA